MFAAVLGLSILPICAVTALAQGEATSPIQLVFATELAPLSFEKAGEAKGILIDIAREVFAVRLEQPVVTTLYPWERAQQMVRSGEADGFITVATTERDSYANCGRIPVLRADLHPIIRPDSPQRTDIEAARNLADLRQFDIVSYFGNGWAKQNLAGHKVFYAQDFQSSLYGLAQGRGDLALGTTTSGAHYMREPDLAGKLVMLPLVVDTFEYVLCFSKNSPHAAKLSEFERVLEVMRMDGGYAPILQGYGMAADAVY
ncbi:MAG: ABC transporter substrate-binding protein [Rhodospirillaceae bacterium]|nr:ABC transporter substrate-binding protein [Rhodospirillaceae bacterium]